MTKDEAISEKKHRPPTKVIMRRLPPTITEQELLEQISPLPAYDYFKFVPADFSLSPWSYSRAYINVTSPDDIVIFRDRFNGYVFVDSKGNEFPAMVEFAPSQKVPQKRTKKDIKCGTIEDDPDFKEFLEELKNPKPSELPTIDSTLADIDKREKELKEGHGCLKVKTPLIEFLEWRKEEKFRRQQEKRRQREEEKQRRDEERKKREKREAQRKQKEKEKEIAKKTASRPERAPRFEKKDEKKTVERYEKYEGVKKFDERYDTGKKYDDRYDSGKNYDDKYDGGNKYDGGKKYNDKYDGGKKYDDKYDGGKRYEEKYDGGKKYEEKKPARKDRFERKKYDDRYDEKYDEKKSNETWDENKSNENFSTGAKEKSKNRYKDKPSVPLYQPGRPRKFSDSQDKPLIFHDPEDN